MKIPLSWVQDYVDLRGVKLDELINGLNKIGFEVEEVFDLARGLEHVVVAKILKTWQHPNADRLTVCLVDAGQQQPLQICTAAKNIKEGDNVPLALAGATLCSGVHIENAIMRGEKSEGMFCGADELGLQEECAEGIYILNNEINAGAKIADVLKRNEIVLEVKFTPNRADAACIVGIAREIAAVLGRRFALPDISYKTVRAVNNIEIEVRDKELCPRYMGAQIINVKNSASPDWMRRRLMLAGYKPHSSIVDITNYVLCEMGQPLHAFDAAKIEGAKIVVRRAAKGEKLLTLDEKERILDTNTLVVADAKKPLVIAGIIGGQESGTYSSTQTVFLESAIFNYTTIRRSAKALSVSTASSSRFARGLSLISAEMGIKRALNLICALGYGQVCAQIKDISAATVQKQTVVASAMRINKRLALNITPQEMCAILTKLDFLANVKGDVITVVVPPERIDICSEADICEEIGRYYGYDNISEENTGASCYVFKGGLLPKQINIDRVKNYLAAQGANEILTFQFISPETMQNFGDNVEKAIEISNPLGREYSLLRLKLLPAMLETIAYNQRQKNLDLFLFETARVFNAETLPLEKLPDEPVHLAMALSEQTGDFYCLKAITDGVAALLGVRFEYRANSTSNQFHPGICADIFCCGKRIGIIGEIHPKICDKFEIAGRICACEVNIDNLIENEVKLKKVRDVRKLPNIERDLAFIVKADVSAGDLIKVACSAAAECEYANVFDVYAGAQVGAGLKSIAIKVSIMQNDKTLNDDEISLVMMRIIAACEAELGAKLRA